jgi:membrane-associated phospholipid phosphatase
VNNQENREPTVEGIPPSRPTPRSGRGRDVRPEPGEGLSFGATDLIILVTLGLFTLLTVVFHGRIDGWGVLVAKNMAVAVAYVIMARLARRSREGVLKFLLRMLPVTLTYGYLFLAVDKLQLMVHGRFLDPALLRLEASIWGGQPTLWLERFTRPALTEWMMFAYIFYFPMYPILCATVYFRHGEKAMEDYFFTLGLTNILCDLGFILLPIAGPMAAMGGEYTVPLGGYFFTWLGELVRTRLQFPGGSLPSPHCAAATVMWAMSYRYCRPLFWMLLPLVLTLYVSTFYCRYHYVSDAVTGILTAALALAVAPRLNRAWSGFRSSSDFEDSGW